MEDYTVDRRGDTGAWVREAAMTGLVSLSLAILGTGVKNVKPSIIAQVMPCLAQQATEKIARTRGHAGKVFSSLLWATAGSGEGMPGVPRIEEVRDIFPKEEDINWTVEAETFPRVYREDYSWPGCQYWGTHRATGQKLEREHVRGVEEHESETAGVLLHQPAVRVQETPE